MSQEKPTIKIYLDKYEENDKPTVVGYKGKSIVDVAFYYCPYIPMVTFFTRIENSFEMKDGSGCVSLVTNNLENLKQILGDNFKEHEYSIEKNIRNNSGEFYIEIVFKQYSYNTKFLLIIK